MSFKEVGKSATLSVRIVVIGLGGWGKNYPRVVEEVDNAELAAVCDLREDRVQRFVKRYGCAGYTKVEDLVQRESFDAAVVAVSTPAHVSVVQQLVGHCTHILVEKPFGASLEEAARMTQLASNRETFLMPGLIMRFNPVIERILGLVGSEEAGEPIMMTATRISYFPPRTQDVGVVKDLAIHDIDVARLLFNGEPTAVYCRAGDLTGRGYEDHATLVLTFGEDRTAFVEANWLTPYKIRNLRITCTRAVLVANTLTQELRIHNERGVHIPSFRWFEPLRREVEYLVEAVQKNQPPKPSARDGLVLHLITDAALQSAREGRVVALDVPRLLEKLGYSSREALDLQK